MGTFLSILLVLPAVASSEVSEVVAKLGASDPAEKDYFGRSVSISGDLIVVGAYYDDDGGSESGSAYVFATTDGGENWP